MTADSILRSKTVLLGIALSAYFAVTFTVGLLRPSSPTRALAAEFDTLYRRIMFSGEIRVDCGAQKSPFNSVLGDSLVRFAEARLSEPGPEELRQLGSLVDQLRLSAADKVIDARECERLIFSPRSTPGSETH